MSIESGIGLSTAQDLVAAVREASATARAECASPAVVLLFVTHNYPIDALPAALQELSGGFPAGTPTAGGTVNGLTAGDARYDAVYANAHAVAVVAIGGPGVRAGVALVGDVAKDPVEAGRTLARAVRETSGGAAPGGIILTPGLSAGLTVIDQPLLNGIRAVDSRLRLTGTGLAGGMRADGTWLPGQAFANGRIETLGAVLVTIAGAEKMGHATANGMQPVGPGGFITDVDGPFIRTIDGKPARDRVLDLLAGTGDSEARQHFEQNPIIAGIERGITLAAPDPEGDFYWCHMPVMFTPEGGVGDYFSPRKGTGLAVCRIDPESCMAAIGEASAMLVEDANADEFDLVLAFSCGLRGYTLGPQIAHEDKELRKHIRAKKQLGIVANGEVGSYKHGRPFATGWVYALFGMAGSEAGHG